MLENFVPRKSGESLSVGKLGWRKFCATGKNLSKKSLRVEEFKVTNNFVDRKF